MDAPFYRLVQDYDALVQTLRERSEQMEIARLELDRLSGLASGYSGKVLAPTRIKFIGSSLGPLLQTLGLILIAVENPAARDTTLALRTPFDASNRRVGNHCNSPRKPAPGIERESVAEIAPSPQQPQQRSEPVSRAHLRVIQPRRAGARWGGGAL
ncbi:hypothetical protein [Bradyrhizobium cytisi]|uniref:Uncharacterized protein n=1 Tax=Bradyrhizobium cytisi TaxID=515489 RepID=A0A5S4WNE5_9BRAD|nr:hypothetical protein [Bradyrhizobium cytisi]TYL83620.1 hypothetical protein FXB38_18160 [Bradyrhizobium cytisi]